MLFLPKTLLTSVKEHQTITTHNTNWHCLVHFYSLCETAFVKTAVYKKQLFIPFVLHVSN